MASLFNFARDARTFRPKKYPARLQNHSELKQRIDVTLGNGDTYEAILRPEGVEMNEWMAINATEFYNSTMLLYSTLVEFCTPDTCPVMSAGPKVNGRRRRRAEATRETLREVRRLHIHIHIHIHPQCWPGH